MLLKKLDERLHWGVLIGFYYSKSTPILLLCILIPPIVYSLADLAVPFVEKIVYSLSGYFISLTFLSIGIWLIRIFSPLELDSAINEESFQNKKFSNYGKSKKNEIFNLLQKKNFINDQYSPCSIDEKDFADAYFKYLIFSRKYVRFLVVAFFLLGISILVSSYINSFLYISAIWLARF